MAAIKPKGAGKPVPVKKFTNMEKYKYSFSFHMPHEEFLECMRYFADGSEARHLQRVREGRAF